MKTFKELIEEFNTLLQSNLKKEIENDEKSHPIAFYLMKSKNIEEFINHQFTRKVEKTDLENLLEEFIENDINTNSFKIVVQHVSYNKFKIRFRNVNIEENNDNCPNSLTEDNEAFFFKVKLDNIVTAKGSYSTQHNKIVSEIEVISNEIENLTPKDFLLKIIDKYNQKKLKEIERNDNKEKLRKENEDLFNKEINSLNISKDKFLEIMEIYKKSL